MQYAIHLTVGEHSARHIRREAGVRVEVADGCAEVPCVEGRLAVDSESGRGLVLLSEVADKWGVDRRSGGGKSVWFECG
nr:hypothetical protein [Streptomyces sp. NBRC 14336]